MISTYDEYNHRAIQWVTRRQAWNLLKDRSYLDGLTYDRVIWCPYESHTDTRPFMTICMYFGWIRLNEKFHDIFLNAC